MIRKIIGLTILGITVIWTVYFIVVIAIASELYGIQSFTRIIYTSIFTIGFPLVTGSLLVFKKTTKIKTKS